MSNWGITWVMDGMQWIVEEVHMFSPGLMAESDFDNRVYTDNYNKLPIVETYVKCLFRAFELTGSRSDTEIIHMHCEEGDYVFYADDLIRILPQWYPEEFL